MATMKAWQITSATGGFENNLFRPASGAPKPVIQDTQILVEVHACAINPADYKVPELGLISKIILPSPLTPCMDFCGKVVEAGSKTTGFKNGDMVFGAYIWELGHGSLAQYIAVRENMITGLPEGVDVDQAATIGAAGLTAYQTIAPNVKGGDKVFVNGGSGGTGTYGIQIAKALGCHVTTCCSTANVELCKGLGADDVIDYKEVDVVEALEKKGRVFKLVVDNIGNLAGAFRRLSASCVLPEGKFIQVSHQSLGGAGHAIGNRLIPGFLGGGKCAYEFYMTKAKAEDLAQLAAWLKEGKIRSVLDSVFEFEDAPKAFEKLKTGRTKGKIVIHVKA